MEVTIEVTCPACGDMFQTIYDASAGFERIAELEAFLRNIADNTATPAVELGQANWMLEQVNQIARAALGGAK